MHIARFSIRFRFAARLPVLGLLLGLAWLGAHAAYLEPGPADSAIRPQPLPPPRPQPAPPEFSPGRDTVLDFLDGLRLLRPYYRDGRTVFPVVLAGAPEDSRRYLTMDEAWDHGWLEVRESGAVNRILLRNRGPQFVFLLGGQLVVGGRQNRMLRSDVLLPPHSGEVSVPVYCVERRRWEGGTGFDHSPGMADFELRAAGRAGVDQEWVWRTVSRRFREHGAACPPTEDYVRGFANSAAGNRARTCARWFRRRLPRRTLGVVVAAEDGRILGADLFCNPALFRKLAGPVLASYALAHRFRNGRCRDRWTVERARHFLDRIRRARAWRERSSAGCGWFSEFFGPGVHGRALIYHDRVIHLVADPRLLRPVEPVPLR